jgi:hypothetical protein
MEKKLIRDGNMENIAKKTPRNEKMWTKPEKIKRKKWTEAKKTTERNRTTKHCQNTSTNEKRRMETKKELKHGKQNKM